LPKSKGRSDFRIEICQNRPDKNLGILENLDTASKGAFRGPVTTTTIPSVKADYNLCCRICVLTRDLA